jgi:hypothetical protein
MSITPASGVSFDASQFKLQADGTFRISIIGMARMAGIDDSSLGRSLRSASAETPLPCARSLLAQGFSPSAVSTWGETGGIPEDAAPFILEHYGINATSPSQQARAVLLAFSRVGINAYLKEKLQLNQQLATLTQPQQNLDWLMSWSQRWGIKFDERDTLQLKEYAMSLALPPAGGAQSIYNDAPVSRLVNELFGVVLGNGKLSKIGTRLAAMWRRDKGTEPPQHDQYVMGANRSVAHYPRDWATDRLKELHADEPQLFCR